MNPVRIIARHVIQSFEIGEVTPELAHEIGKQFADEILGGKYEYVLTTHIDKDHVHNLSLIHIWEIPKQAHGSINLDGHTSSTRKIMCAVSELFDRIVDKNLLVRRMYVVANHVLPEADAPKKNDGAVQLDLFTDYAAEEKKQKAENAALERERKIQAATLAIKKKYGKNAILKAMNLEEGATAKDRNAQIGGHKA